MEAGAILEIHPAVIFKLMSHRESVVRTLVLQEILRVASSSEKISGLLRNTDLLVAVVERIADDDLTAAKFAMNVLKKVGNSNEGCNIIYTGILLRSIAKLLPKNDIVSFRIYEVVVDIAKNSKEGLEVSIRSGFLQSLISTLDNNDILLQLNALEALTALALTEDGLNFLENQDVLQQLAQKIARANETPLSHLLIPGLMKFFGNVAQFRPNEIFSRHPIVVSALFEVIDSGDPILLGSALDTLGNVASGIEGKYALQALGDTMSGALRKIEEVILKMPTELRLRGLNNLTRILDVKKSEQDNRILSLTKSWFDCICEEPLKMVVSLCKQPFADIRQASLELLAVIASQAWGQEYIANHPGLMEFLLDRHVESFKECKEAKFAVVRILSDSPDDIFDTHTMQRLKQFTTEGPFYVDTNTEVATEGAA